MKLAKLGTAVLAATLAGCSTTGTVKFNEDGQPLSGLINTEREVRSFVSRAHDPREFAITISTAADGAPVIVNANRVRPGLQANASFVSPPHTSLAVIDGEMNDRPIRILVDPTSSANWTSIERAGLFGLTAIAPPLISGAPEHVMDIVRGTLCVAPALTVDLMSVDAALFYARASRGPLWPLSRSADAQDVDFVFGWSLLRAFQYVRWDFSGRVLVLSSRPYGADEKRLLAQVPLENGFDALVVKGMVDGKTKSILIDLAGDFELATDEATMTLVRQVSLGDVVLRDLHPSTLGSHGLGFPGTPRLGLRALSKFCLVLDNRRNELLIEAPASVPMPAR